VAVVVVVMVLLPCNNKCIRIIEVHPMGNIMMIMQWVVGEIKGGEMNLTIMDITMEAVEINFQEKIGIDDEKLDWLN